ncbi:WD repeat-containing protein [Acrasis kona]|uniref:WD repeat-containing protein n=1 Tax=Acrasis kona TaxID=1008807 RepID=A0AAW2ZIF3_9EUKA
MPRAVRSATTSKKPLRGDKNATVNSSASYTMQPLSEKDRETAERFLREDQEDKLEEKEFESKQKNVRNRFIKKTGAILDQVEQGFVYKKIQKNDLSVLEKYQRPTKKVDIYTQKRFQFNSKKRNRQENVRNAIFDDQDRAQAEIGLVQTEIIRDAVPLIATGIELDDSDVVTTTNQLTQEALLDSVDMNTRRKVFDIQLSQHSPYIMQFTQSGRYMLIAGRRGYLSSVRWRDFEMKSEVHTINESIRAIQWMMEDSMYAVAQSSLTYVYDENGVEIHRCIDFQKMNHLSYLPFHFLLVGANASAQVIYKDISLGENVATLQMDPITFMTQNPKNALMVLGHTNGTVSMVTPRDSSHKPVVSMFCHKAPVKQLAVDPTGNYLVTCGSDATVKVWDIRTYKCIESINTHQVQASAFSQKGMLALAHKNKVVVYQSCGALNKPYLTHYTPANIGSLSFCPFEDILGVGHTKGVSSVLIPGSGEPKFDSRMPNPYCDDKFIKDWNVRSLLDKLPFDSICLDDGAIGTSGTRETDYQYSSKVEVSDELKQELQQVGVVDKKNKKRVSSRDELRESLRAKDAEVKDKVGGDWWDQSEDALDRFSSLKKRKLAYDKNAKEQVRDAIERGQAEDEAKEFEDNVEVTGASLKELLGDDDGEVVRITKKKGYVEEYESEDDTQSESSESEASEDNEDVQSEDEQDIVDPFA